MHHTKRSAKTINKTGTIISSVLPCLLNVGYMRRYRLKS
nr:MAG TPA: hypothetical protein [Caudoviricetes sp.]